MQEVNAIETAPQRVYYQSHNAWHLTEGRASESSNRRTLDRQYTLIPKHVPFTSTARDRRLSYGTRMLHDTVYKDANEPPWLLASRLRTHVEGRSSKRNSARYSAMRLLVSNGIHMCQRTGQRIVLVNLPVRFVPFCTPSTR